MKIKTIFLILLLIFVPLAKAVTHQDKTIEITQTPDSARPCVFFKLSGVSEADPVNANNPWFSIPVEEKEQISFLLAARMANKTVTVYTTGQLACGHAEVNLFQL